MNIGGIEPSPAVIVRVASWPLRCITELADPQLARMARRGAPERPEYLEAHAEALERQRRALWQQTVADPRFLCALAIANPTLARSLVGEPLPSRRNKRARHLETTLYRYLARAVARPEPCGQWAGVTLASWGSRRRCGRAKARWSVAPDLSPLREIVTVLATRAPYPERGRYKLNPTLERQADGSYRLWSGPESPPSTLRRLGGSATIDAALAALEAATPCTQAQATSVLVETPGLEPAMAQRLVETLCTSGVLVGGLSFPRLFSDPWEALVLVESALQADHAQVWRIASRRLHDVAERLTAALPEFDVDAALAAMDATQGIFEDLARDLGIDPPQPSRAPLRCDALAPWSIELGPADAERLVHTIQSADRYEDDEGVYGPLMRLATTRMLATSPTTGLAGVTPSPMASETDGLVTWESFVASLGGDPQLASRSQQRGRRLEQPGAEQWISPRGQEVGPPLAALYASFVKPGLGGQPLVLGITVNATAAYSRVAPLLMGVGPCDLTRWFREQYRLIAERTGVDRVALLYDHPNPNVLAQPDLGGDTLDPWGLTPGRLPDRGLSITHDAKGMTLLRVPGRARPVVVLSPTAAAVPPGAPCLHALLLTSHHVPPLLPGGARMVHAAELRAPRHRPRVRLDGGAVIQPRRTFVRGAELHALAHSRGAARFAHWQELAATHGWPPLLFVRRDRKPPLLVARDCPLAIEAAFEGSRKSAYVLVEEFIKDAWIGDEDEDRRYIADVVLPFVRHLDSPRGADRSHPVDPARHRPDLPRGINASQ